MASNGIAGIPRNFAISSCLRIFRNTSTFKLFNPDSHINVQFSTNAFVYTYRYLHETHISVIYFGGRCQTRVPFIVSNPSKCVYQLIITPAIAGHSRARLANVGHVLSLHLLGQSILLQTVRFVFYVFPLVFCHGI
jgi:hypothetical protein